MLTVKSRVDFGGVNDWDYCLIENSCSTCD